MSGHFRARWRHHEIQASSPTGLAASLNGRTKPRINRGIDIRCGRPHSGKYRNSPASVAVLRIAWHSPAALGFMALEVYERLCRPVSPVSSAGWRFIGRYLPCRVLVIVYPLAMASACANRYHFAASWHRYSALGDSQANIVSKSSNRTLRRIRAYSAIAAQARPACGLRRLGAAWPAAACRCSPPYVRRRAKCHEKPAAEPSEALIDEA